MVKNRRGFSLVEVAVIMTLTLTLLALTAGYFVRGQRYAAETETYSSVQRTASQALRRMTNDIYRANADQMSTAGQSIAFLSYAPALQQGTELELQTGAGAGAGSILWKKWQGFFYDDATDTLYRGEVKLVAPVALPADALPALEAADFPTAGSLVRERLPGQISKCTFTRLGRRVRIELAAIGQAPISVQKNEQREVEIQVTTEVSVIN
jgi:hypothetical protein